MSNEITNINTAIPKIYKAICSIIGDIGAVGKDKKNEQQNYRYRAIDDVYNALNPALAKYGVVIVPNVLEVTKADRATKSGTVMTYATVRVNYTFYCAEDGSSINSEVQGEGSDTGDKSINKAMSAAMKYMCFQVFCIPTEELNEDADKTTPEANKPEPKKAENTEKIICADCGKEMLDLKKPSGTTVKKEAVKEYSEKTYGRCLCLDCQKKAEQNKENQPENSGKPNADYIKESYQRRKDYALSTGTNPNEIISEKQLNRMFAIAGKGREPLIREVIAKYGYNSAKTIKRGDYENICNDIEQGIALYDETGEATMNEHLQEQQGLSDDIPFDDKLPFNMGEVSA